MDTPIIPAAGPDPRSLMRARFEPRRRVLTVQNVQSLTPGMLRISFSADLSGFNSLSFDDHIKLFFPDLATGILTVPDPTALETASGPKPIMRDYTPRAFDRAAGTIVIDFAVHEAGPATQWALSAKPGDELHVGGPRGSTIIPIAFDGYVLIGDDTALPAIGRRLEELPEGARAIVIAEVESEAHRLTFETRTDLRLNWVYRRGPAGQNTLFDAVKATHFPQNDIHVWVACEADQAKRIRTELIEEHGVNPKWLKASGYWRQGQIGTHEKIED